MDLWLGILIGVCLALAVFAVVGRRAVKGAMTGTDPTQLTFDPQVMQQANGLISGGQKIEAITLLRAHTPGLGLAAAKAIVDKMAVAQQRARATGPAPAGLQPSAFADDLPTPAGATPLDAASLDASPGFDTSPSLSALALDVELTARSLKADGQKIEAIKLIREHTGWGLREAKDFVDAL